MPNFTTTISHDSATTPGVKFVVRRMTEGTRRQLRLRLASAFAKLRAIDADRDDMIEDAAARLGKTIDAVFVSELSRDERRRLQEFVESAELIRDTEIHPVYVDAGLISIEGLTIDDAPATTAADLARVPGGELYREVLAAVKAAAGLASETRPNSASPSTSGAVEGGEIAGSIAPDASASSNTASTAAPAAS